MEAKLEFLRKGLTGEIWGLVGPDGMVIRQYPSKTGKEAFEFFKEQAESLKSDDKVSSISFEGKVVTL
jgi:hypothetical protein